MEETVQIVTVATRFLLVRNAQEVDMQACWSDGREGTESIPGSDSSGVIRPQHVLSPVRAPRAKRARESESAAIDIPAAGSCDLFSEALDVDQLMGTRCIGGQGDRLFLLAVIFPVSLSDCAFRPLPFRPFATCGDRRSSIPK